MLSSVLLAGFVAGCALWSPYLRPEFPAGRPPLYAVRHAETYRQLRDRWTRDASLGFANHVWATLDDPQLMRVAISDEGEQQGLVGGLFREMARQAWQALYGDPGLGIGRIPIDVRWSFDKAFHPENHADPANWRFTLSSDRGSTVSALSVGTPEASPSATAWIETFRLWFPDRVLVPGTRLLTLRLRGPGGEGAVGWQFAPLTDRGD